MIRRDFRIGSRLLQTSLVEELNLSNLQAQWQVSIDQSRMLAKFLTIFPLEVNLVNATVKADLLEPRETNLWVDILT